MKWLVFLALSFSLIACDKDKDQDTAPSKAADKPKVTAEVKPEPVVATPPCADVVAHMEKLGKSKAPEQIQKMCDTMKWSAESRKCILDAQTKEATAACLKKIPGIQEYVNKSKASQQ